MPRHVLRIPINGCQRRPRPQPPRNGPQFSGFVIARLADHVESGGPDSLLDLAKRNRLEGLQRVLERFDLSSTARVVRSLDEQRLLDLERRAAKTELPPLHSLTRYWRIDLRDAPGATAEVLAALQQLREVDSAYRELTVSEPVVDASDDTYADQQDYLDEAPTGINARWVWDQPNGAGAGVGVVDLEQGWFPTHEDLVAKAPTLIYGDNRDGVGTYKGNHGTAVLGEMVAEDNAHGVVGIAPAVTSVRMTSHYDAATDTSLHVADAIVAAIPVMNPGDLLLLEVQRAYRPTEVDDADFDAIRLASALGIVVVEAAGNGDVDLDAYTDAAGDTILDRTSPDFRESGAIMVGAAESTVPHDRAWYSNYGSRIDCYAWGYDVVTCGYGDLDAGSGDDSTYTDTFSGTSSASPIVTGAALLLQGMYEATAGTRLSPGQMRSLLSDPTTGTAQGAGVAGNIGVMPNLRSIVEDALDLVPDVYVRDAVGDTGTIPFGGSISASPDIIVRPTAVADPDAAFGEGSGTENSSTEGHEVEAGQDNFVYVRMQNRGGSDAASVRATVYWSEVATLVTPDMWHLIGTTAPVDVPQGDTLVVADPLTWAAAGIPATGHYCFVGLIDHPRDPAPPVPAAMDWDAFRDLVRNHNNVTWRNFNVVDELPDPEADPIELPFLIAGAPDHARRFDLEIFQAFPRGAELWLEVPAGLGKRIVRRTFWATRRGRDRESILIRVPAQPRVLLCDVHLPRRARYRARFLVRGTKAMRRGGHRFGIRQLFDQEEVGRVTWQFRIRQPRGKC